MKKILAVFFAVLYFNTYCFAATVKSGTWIVLNPAQNYTSKDEPAKIRAVVQNDVVVDGKTVFKSGSPAVINIADIQKAKRMGKGGYIIFGNGQVKDVNGVDRRVLYQYKLVGKDKTWVPVTFWCGFALLFPIMFFGLVRGDEAKALSTFEMEVYTASDFDI